MPAKGLDTLSMPTSIYLAKLMGPVFLAVGVGCLVNGATFRKLAGEFLDSLALIFLSGLLLMTAGLAVVLAHNVWVADWRVLITVIGWLATVGGAVRVICPQSKQHLGHRLLGHKQALPIAGAIWLAIGAIRCFFGYVR